MEKEISEIHSTPISDTGDRHIRVMDRVTDRVLSTRVIYKPLGYIQATSSPINFFNRSILP